MCRRNKSAIPCHAKGKEFFLLNSLFFYSFFLSRNYLCLVSRQVFFYRWILNKQASQNFAPSYSLIFFTGFSVHITHAKFNFYWFYPLTRIFFLHIFFHVIIVISFPSSQNISNCLPLLVKYMICMLLLCDFFLYKMNTSHRYSH